MPGRLAVLAAYFLFAGAFCAAQTQSSPSLDARKTVRPARNKARKERRARGASRRTRRVRTPVLAQGRWSPQVRQSLERLIELKGSASPDYSAADPPVAIFTWDDISASHNVGEAVFHRLVNRAEFKFDRDFWDLIPMQCGRERIRAGYNGFIAAPRSTWTQDAYYKVYRKAFFRGYQSLCAQAGRSECGRWLASLLKGFSEPELRALAADTVERELDGPLGEEAVGDSAEDPDPVNIRVGLRKIPEMEDLYRKLLDKGFDVWVMSATDQWVLEAFARLYKVDPSRIVGIKAKIAQDKLTGEVEEPIPYGEGKAEDMTLLIGDSPALVMGGAGDEALMSYGQGLRVWIADEGSPLPDEGKKKGWLVQPAFRSVTASQSAKPNP